MNNLHFSGLDQAQGFNNQKHAHCLSTFDIRIQLKNALNNHLKKLTMELNLPETNLRIVSHGLDNACYHNFDLNTSQLQISPLYLLAFAPHLLKPDLMVPTNDPRLETQEYWQLLSNWFSDVFDLEYKPVISNLEDMSILGEILTAALYDPSNFIEVLNPYLKSTLKIAAHHNKLCSVITPIMEQIKFENKKKTPIRFADPIETSLAYANKTSVHICPLFIIDWDNLPEQIRPTDSNDPRLYNLQFLQELSDWIADEYGICKQTVTIMEIPAIRTILKLKEKGQENYQKALSAGLVHELGHLAHKHSDQISKENKSISISASKWGKALAVLACAITITAVFALHLPLLDCIGITIAATIISPLVFFCAKKIIFFTKNSWITKTCEREADRYAVEHLKEVGVEGIEIGFPAWQESLKELREHPHFNWKQRLMLKLSITPAGNAVPLLFSHGSFKDRIRRAHTALHKYK